MIRGLASGAVGDEGRTQRRYPRVKETKSDETGDGESERFVVPLSRGNGAERTPGREGNAVLTTPPEGNRTGTLSPGACQRDDGGSRIGWRVREHEEPDAGDLHVRICGSPGGKPPGDPAQRDFPKGPYPFISKNRYVDPMNRTRYPMFLLKQRDKLLHGSPTKDMIDALKDPELTVNAEGVLSVICEWMELHNSHEFIIYTNETNYYNTSLSTALSAFLKQMPGLIAWLAQPLLFIYNLDINQQGRDLRIELRRTKDLVDCTCVEDFWRTAVRVEGYFHNTPDSIRSDCKSIAIEIAAVAKLLDAASLPSFREWSAKCGHELNADF